MGTIRLVVFDEREGSSTKGNFMEIDMGEREYKLVRVPPGLWYGFQGIGTLPALVANCTNLPYQEEEVLRCPLERIPYRWMNRV